MAKSTDKQKCI